MQQYYASLVSTAGKAVAFLLGASLLLAMTVHSEDALVLEEWMTGDSHTPPGLSQGPLPKVSFIFTMGLEGDTSAHLRMGKVARESPSMKFLQEIGVAPGELIELHRLLYQYDPLDSDDDGGQEKGKYPQNPGLWNAHCRLPNDPVDSRPIRQALIQHLKSMQETVHKHLSKATDMKGPVLIPVNTVLFRKDDTTPNKVESHVGMLTYPSSFHDAPCNRLDYPSLHLWYDACDEAGVDCRHVLVTQPPRFTLLSAIEEEELSNPQALARTHLYNTMHQVMANQIWTFAPRTLACVHLPNATDVQTYMDLWQIPSSEMLYTQANMKLDDVPMEDISLEDLQEEFPKQYSPFVNSYMFLHRATKDACSHALEEQRSQVH